MPKVSFTGPDGRDYSFEAPQGADQKFIDAAIRQIVLDNVDTSQARGGFGAAVGASVEGLKSAGAAFLGRTGVIAPETAEQYMAEREAIQRQSFAPTQEGWLGAPVTKTLETLGQSLPFMVAPIVGAAAGVAAAGSAPAWLAAGLGATALSALQFTGTNLQRQVDEGKKLEETDLVAAGTAAVPQALLDTVALRYIPGIRRIFGEIGKDITEEQAEKIIKRGILANMGAAGAKTASAEALTEVGQQAIERFQAGLQVLDDAGKEELIESAIGGGVLGFLFGIPGAGGVRGAAQKRLVEAEQKRQEAEAEAEAQRQAALTGPQTPERPAPPAIREQLTDYDRALFEAQFPPITESPVTGPEAAGAVAPVTPAQPAEPSAPTSGTPPPEIVQLIGEQNEREVAAVRAAKEEQEQVDRLRFESDLAALDAEIRNKEQKTAEDQRLALLLPLIEDPNIKSIPSAFDRALKNAGITNTAFTERERNLIQRATDFRLAEPAPVETLPSVPGAAELESQIKERATTRDPEQLTLPGVMGKGAAKRLGRTRDAVEPETTAPTALGPTPVIDEQALDTLKLPKAAAIRKRLLGKDLSDPQQRQEVNTELRAALQNPNLPKESKDAIRDVLAQSDFTRQGEMFGPRGGVLPGAVPPQGVPDATAQQPTAAAAAPTPEPTLERPTSEPSVDVAGVGAGPTTTQTGAPGAVQEPTVGRLASTDASVEPNVVRSAGEPATVAEPQAPQAPTTATTPDPFVAAVQQLAEATKPTKTEPTTETKAEPKTTRYAEDLVKGLNWGRPASKLTNVAGAPLQNRLDQDVLTALSNGDLIGALNTLAGRTKGITSQLAKVLAGRLAGVKVELVDDAALRRRIFERTGKVEPDVKGVFFASDNTIYINSDIGLDAHTLLHESVHAVVDKVLGNKASPLTKQLQKLYDDVKGGIGSVYGTTDLKEFAAEVMSNPQFREVLDTLYPDGKSISALRRVLNSIGNFLRGLINRPPKSVDSALNAADDLIYSMMEPGQTALQPTTTMQQHSFLKTGDQPIAAVPLLDKALPFMSQDQKDNLRRVMREKGSGGVKALVRMSLPLNALVDVAKNLLPSATRVEELIRLRTGTENKRHQMIEPIEQEANQFAKKASLDTMTKYNDVVYESTQKGVDPSKPRDAYAGDKTKLEVWDGMQADWKAIGPEGQRLYTRMRDTYKKMYEQILDVIDERFNTVTADPEANKQIKKDILAKLKDAAGQIDPYFPLTREGDYWVSYSLQGGGNSDFVVEAFKTPAARDRAMAAIRQDPNFVDGSLELYAKNDRINYANAPSGSFMNSVFSVLKANRVDPEVTQEMMNLFLNSLPASAFAQSFRKRKGREGEGVAGFERDAVKAFRSKVYSVSRQLANIEYGAKLNDARDKLNAEADAAYRAGNEDARDYKEEFNKRIDFAVRPSVERWSQVATSYGFLATLGFNLSSALVNLSQIPLMIMPYYAGKYGLGATMGAIGKATKLYMNSGFSQDRETILGDRKRMRVAPSLQNYTFKDGDPYKYLVEVAQDLGQMNRSQTYDILDVTGNDSPLAKVNALSGFIFHHGERMNREIALASAYELELQKLGKNPTANQMREAAKQAVHMTELTNGGIAAAAAPRIAQNSLGRVMFMYKRYGVSMYYAMFKTARDMLKGETPEVRRAGMKQVAGIFLSAGMLAGVQGLPLYGIGALIYNMFKEDDEDTADVAVRKYLGEGLYKGPVNFLTGADIASRVGLSDLLFRDNPMKRDQEPMAEIMEFIGGPVYSVANRALRGTKDIKEGEVWRGVEQILPSAFGNVMKSIRFMTEGVNTRRGDPVLEDLGFGSAVAQVFGFAPAEYTRQLEINSVEKGKERAVNETRTKLLRQLYLSTREGDSEGTSEIMEKIAKFNERHPTLAITSSSLRRSMKQHARTTAQMYNGVTYSKKYLPEFLRSRAEYGDDDD